MALGHWAAASDRSDSIEKFWVPVAGHSMNCLRTGSGPELVLLHGILGTASTWEPAFSALASQSTVHAIDALGIGESDRVPRLDARLEAQSQRVIEFMDNAGIGSADFLATSHGGAVALMLSAHYPSRVRSLLLHAPANPFSHICDPLINFYLSGLGTWFAHRVPNLPESMQSVALGRMYGDPAQLRVGSLGKYINSLRVPGTVDYVLDVLKAWFDDMAKLRTALDRVRPIPALLIWGDRDRAVTLDSASELERCFDDAQFELLSGTGHLPFEECPDRFAGIVNRFLRRVREPGPQLVRKPSGSL
jgi:pimeloyl-ACP methyl ester carboxylesterase